MKRSFQITYPSQSHCKCVSYQSSKPSYTKRLMASAYQASAFGASALGASALPSQRGPGPGEVTPKKGGRELANVAYTPED